MPLIDGKIHTLVFDWLTGSRIGAVTLMLCHSFKPLEHRSDVVGSQL
jgi:hypothetical protein